MAAAADRQGVGLQECNAIIAYGLNDMTPQELYERYSSAVAYVVVKTQTGDESIGSAFHVGDGVFVTARHVVDGNEMLHIGTTTSILVDDPNGPVTIHDKPGKFREILPGEGIIRSGPHFHPDDSIDVAAITVDGLEPPIIPLGSHLDDWMNDDAFMLAQVLIMGYPPIPFSNRPQLVAARAEINAVVDKYTGGHPHFVVSAMPRGGFSGGPCIVEWDFALGLVTESLIAGDHPTELGFMAVLTVESIFVCLQHHKLVPAEQKEGWDGLWD